MLTNNFRTTETTKLLTVAISQLPYDKFGISTPPIVQLITVLSSDKYTICMELMFCVSFSNPRTHVCRTYLMNLPMDLLSNFTWTSFSNLSWFHSVINITFQISDQKIRQNVLVHIVSVIVFIQFTTSFKCRAGTNTLQTQSLDSDCSISSRLSQFSHYAFHCTSPFNRFTTVRVLYNMN